MTLYTEILPSGFSFDMIFVEGGLFYLGKEDGGFLDEERPVHQVEVSGFYLGKFPVTQGLWKAVMGANNNPSNFKGDLRPVETIQWDDSQKFIEKLNFLTKEQHEAQDLGAYRLPSEAEWEFAALGGNYSEGYLYAGSDKLNEVGWYRENSNDQTQDVGLLMANELGFYDLSGNVYEWTEDHWHNNYEGAPTNGSAWLSIYTAAGHVARGGYWFNPKGFCTVSKRWHRGVGTSYNPFGFRLAMSLRSTG